MKMKMMMMMLLLLYSSAASIRRAEVHAFQQISAVRAPQRRQIPTVIVPHRHHNMILTSRDADFVEQMAGGERYSLVPMPDSMKTTTVFVGNLCEFVQDEDLSRLFAAASRLLRVPAIVVRKPDTQSLRYGFVSFPTRQEKEVCVCRVCVKVCVAVCV